MIATATATATTTTRAATRACALRQFQRRASRLLVRNQPSLASLGSRNSWLTSNITPMPASSVGTSLRFMSTDDTAEDTKYSVLNAPRDQMAFDVLIVGGGPAGLSASIRLKQKCPDLSVCIIEKGSEIGSHILSGNVFDPKALHELFPDDSDNWAEIMMSELPSSQQAMPTKVINDQFQILLSETSKFTVPHLFLPSQLHNTNGNYIISLSQLCRWLAQRAEALGVEIYAGFAASEVLYETDSDNLPTGVRGIATRDVGIAKDGKPKSTFERGVELVARQTLFAEGARGSCSEDILQQMKLRNDNNGHHQTYGLGIKEVWEVNPESPNFQPGLVQHAVGFPLQSSMLDKTFGGSFIYHQKPNLVLLGIVVGLDYADPKLNPYQEFQLLKTHSSIQPLLQEGESSCISYGARVLNEGGYHAIPSRLSFPGGALIGCSAGFLNAVKIKGTHTAMKSGMVAADSIIEDLVGDNADSFVSVGETGELSHGHIPSEIASYQSNLEQSWVYEELYQVRNVHQAFTKWGIAIGMVYTGLATHITKGREPWTLVNAPSKTDAECTSEVGESKLDSKYKLPDQKTTFDLLTNLQRSNTYHEEDQPAHLRIKPHLQHVPEDISLPVYGGPEQRFCPAGVYEYVGNDGDGGKKKLVINAQNCVHCKCCSIKMPKEYIDWTVPEGGGGPQYQIM